MTSIFRSTLLPDFEGIGGQRYPASTRTRTRISLSQSSGHAESSKPTDLTSVTSGAKQRDREDKGKSPVHSPSNLAGGQDQGLLEHIGAGISEISHHPEELANTLGLNDQGRQDGMKRRKRTTVRVAKTKPRKSGLFHNSRKVERDKKNRKAMARQSKAPVGNGRDESAPESESSAKNVIWDFD
jgi:hypothetical protein